MRDKENRKRAQQEETIAHNGLEMGGNDRKACFPGWNFIDFQIIFYRFNRKLPGTIYHQRSVMQHMAHIFRKILR